MKKIALVLLALPLLLNGCLLTSFNPFFKPADVVTNNLLLGDWIGKNALLTFSQLENSAYLVNYKDCEDPYNAPDDYSTCTVADLTVNLIKLGDNYFFDVYPRNYLNSDNLFLNLHVRPAHSLAKVKIEKNRLEIRMVSYSWVQEHLENSKEKLSHIKVDDLITLTATIEELQAFVLKHQNDPGFFDDPIVLKAK